MDNSSISRNRSNNDHLGVNKVGKNIKKSPIHQPNFTNSARQQPQPQVYNINKNDFRDIVQQLTGSPSHESRPRPPPNPPKPPSSRLQKIRPPPLAPLNRPQMHMHPQPQAPPGPVPQYPTMAVPPHNNMVRPPPHFGQPSPTMLPPAVPGDPFRPNVAESPISAYMRYLQSSFIDPISEQTHSQNQAQSHYLMQSQPRGPGPVPAQPHTSGLLPNPGATSLLSPRMSCAPPFPSPRMNAHPPLMSPRFNDYPPVLSPRFGGPPLLPSPTSQFLLPSPTGFPNLLSPRSPYLALSPGYQFPPPLTPNFGFSPVGQSGILGPGPQPPPSPGIGFPLSPSVFFPITSPRWRDQRA